MRVSAVSNGKDNFLMSHFLRDQLLNNLTIHEDSLIHINTIFNARGLTAKSNIEELDEHGCRKAFLTYIIRFDNKGYRVFSLEELLSYFNNAKNVERVIYTLEDAESLRTNRSTGTFLELRLDAQDQNMCLLNATSDDKDWVESSISSLNEALEKYKNKNGWFRTNWTQFAVQIFGVLIGFVFSIWGALKIAPKVSIDSAFLIMFILLFLIFSNVWTFVYQKILSYINLIFPNIKFVRQNKYALHWIQQLVIGTFLISIMIFLLNKGFSFFADILASFLNKTS